MIGFGEGQTDIQVVANVQDLSQGPPKPLYEVATDASSGDKPGAGPTLVLGPYGAAARFVIAGTGLGYEREADRRPDCRANGQTRATGELNSGDPRPTFGRKKARV